MPKKEEPEFTVTDRRKFTLEGDVRPETEAAEQSFAPQSTDVLAERPPTPPAQETSTSSPAQPSTADQEPAAPKAPSREEQERQRGEYNQSAKSIEDELRRGYGPQAVPEHEPTFDRLIEPFYLTSLMQLGMLPAERGAQAQVDIVGARHTIDTLSYLQEKTKGNLNREEADVLETVLYQLRMRYIELTNAIAQSVHTKGEGEPGGPGSRQL
jgi:hypothetical protein